MFYALKVEYVNKKKIRARNTVPYRISHLPIWIFVYFLAPGPLTFDLFAYGGNWMHRVWLAVVIAGTAIAGYFGQLPGVEPKPYILLYNENKPNPLYRRICYSFCWNAILNFAVLNLTGLVVAVATGHWILDRIYSRGYFPVLAIVLLAGILGILPRAGTSTKGESYERRYFYGAVWSVTLAQITLLVLWKSLPKTHVTDIEKLIAYVAVLMVTGTASAFGFFPRTRPVLPGELMVAD